MSSKNAPTRVPDNPIKSDEPNWYITFAMVACVHRNEDCLCCDVYTDFEFNGQMLAFHLGLAHLRVVNLQSIPKKLLWNSHVGHREEKTRSVCCPCKVA